MSGKFAKVDEWYTQTAKEFRQDVRRNISVYWANSWIAKVIKNREGRGVLIVGLISLLGVLIKGESQTPVWETVFDNLDSIALASAGIIFLLEIKDRQNRDHYEAWQVINSAQGQTGSGGRIQALRDLNRDGVSLEGIAAPRAYLLEINLRGAKLARANLRYARLDYANLQETNLKNAHLEGAQLNFAHLEGAKLEYAHLEEAKLNSAHLEGADLRDAHLEGAQLNSAHLEGADLRGAHLEEAKLNSAHLEGAILENTHLERAQLNFAHLEGASLEGAELENACLFGAIFDVDTHLLNANFRKADLENAQGLTPHHRSDISLCETIMPDGKKSCRDCGIFEDHPEPQEEE